MKDLNFSRRYCLLVIFIDWRGRCLFNARKLWIHDQVTSLLLVKMIDSNMFLLFLLKKNQKLVCIHNLNLIQYIMRSSEAVNIKFQYICAYFLNSIHIINSATRGKVQLTLAHNTIRNKKCGEDFFYNLSVSWKASIDISFDTSCAFAISREKIRITTTKVLLHAAVGNLAWSKMHFNWTPVNYGLPSRIPCQWDHSGHTGICNGAVEYIFSQGFWFW